MLKRINKLQNSLDSFRNVDFLGPLALRLYLVPIFWMAGTKKLAAFDSTVAWFGNPDYGLGLPFPTLLAGLATWAEIIGALCLLLGLAVRWASIPLMVTMLVAAVTVHAKNGWLAIAEGSGFFANEQTAGAIDRLNAAKSLLQQHGNYEWLTENGSFVVLNNGIEFSATYFLMLLVLFFIGSGKYLSADYWIAKKFRNKDDHR